MVLSVLVEADARVAGMGEVGLRTVSVCAHCAWGAERGPESRLKCLCKCKGPPEAVAGQPKFSINSQSEWDEFAMGCSVALQCCYLPC